MRQSIISVLNNNVCCKRQYTLKFENKYICYREPHILEVWNRYIYYERLHILRVWVSELKRIGLVSILFYFIYSRVEDKENRVGHYHRSLDMVIEVICSYNTREQCR